jgi:hypothetical protein
MVSFLLPFSLHNLHGHALEHLQPDGSVVVSYFTKRCNLEFASSSCLIIVFPPGSTSSAISEEIDVLGEPLWVIAAVPWGNSGSESFEKQVHHCGLVIHIGGSSDATILQLGYNQTASCRPF